MTDSPSSFSSECKAILLIDGHHSDRLHYAECLTVSSPEYAVFQTINGQAGLDICNAHPMDCVVLELDLPDMSGFDVLAKLNSLRRRPDMAVIILTRLDNQFLLEAALTMGARFSLRKSLTSGDLLSRAVSSVLQVRAPLHRVAS